MTKAIMIKSLGTALSVVLAGLAVQYHSNPLVMAILPAVSAFLLGALHVQPPSDALPPRSP